MLSTIFAALAGAVVGCEADIEIPSGRASQGGQSTVADADDQVPAAPIQASGLRLSVEVRDAARAGYRIMTVRAHDGAWKLRQPIVKVLSRVASGRSVARREMPPSGGLLTSSFDALSAERARELAFAAGLGPADPEPVLIDVGNGLRHMWRLDPPPTFSPPHDWTWLVDAETGVLHRDLDELVRADVNVFPIDPIETPTPEVRTLDAIDEQSGALSGPYFRAFNCVEPPGLEGQCVSQQVAAPDLNGDYLYDPPDLGTPDPTDEFAEVSAYFHADRFRRILGDHGFAGFVCEDQGTYLGLTANFRLYEAGTWEPFEDATYAPGSCEAAVFLGQGERDAAYDGDLIYHELGHGVFERQIGTANVEPTEHALLYDAGAINEAIADFWGAALTDDSLVAGYFMGERGRDLDNDFSCPVDLVGEVHVDGKQIGAALWASYVDLGSDLFPSILDTMAMLEPSVTFEALAQTLVDVVEDQMGTAARDTVQSHFEARNLLACERIVDLEALGAGGPHTVHDVFGGTLQGAIFLRAPTWVGMFEPVAPPPFQIRVTLPDDAIGATVTFERLVVDPTGDQPTPDIGLGFKRGAPITFTYQPSGPNQYEVDADPEDFVLLAEDRVELDAAGGEVVYLAFHNMGGEQGAGPFVILHDFAVDFEQDGGDGSGTDDGSGSEEGSTTGDGNTTDEGDTDTDEQSGSGADAGSANGDGCGCRSDAGRRTSGALWLGAAFAAATFRRRRARLRRSVVAPRTGS